MRDTAGRRIADGNFVQWNGMNGLHVQIAYAAPSDPIVRIDLLPGRPSEAATPVATGGTRIKRSGD